MNGSSPVRQLVAVPETRVARATAALSAARSIANEAVNELTEHLREASKLCLEIRDGGELYKAGVRDLCSRLIDELDGKAQTIQAIQTRATD